MCFKFQTIKPLFAGFMPVWIEAMRTFTTSAKKGLDAEYIKPIQTKKGWTFFINIF